MDINVIDAFLANPGSRLQWLWVIWHWRRFASEGSTKIMPKIVQAIRAMIRSFSEKKSERRAQNLSFHVENGKIESNGREESRQNSLTDSKLNAAFHGCNVSFADFASSRSDEETVGMVF